MDDCKNADSGCEVCDLLTDGATLTAKVSLSAPVAALIHDLPLTVSVSTLTLAHVFVPTQSLPPQRKRLCEILAGTACPVRGPTSRHV